MSGKIKLIIFAGIFLPNVGGSETHIDELCKYLSKNKKYDITIFTPNGFNAKEFEILHNNVKVIRYPGFIGTKDFLLPKFWSLKFWKMYFNLYKQDFNIVMTRTRFFPNCFLGMIFAKFRLNKVKYIHVEHGSDYVIFSSKIKTFLALVYDKIIGNLIFFFSDKYLAISKVSSDFVKKAFVGEDKEIQIIKRGVDFELYDKINIDKNIKDKFKGKILIGSLCRLAKWKGVENSIKAFMSLPEEIKEKCVYLVVGDGDELIYLKKLARGEKRIVFLGLVDFDKAISLLKFFDIFVHSSYPGGALSNSLLQALYCKCAVVASPNEGANEVVFDGKTGLLMKNNSSVELSKGMLKLIKNKKLRADLSTSANEYILEKFNWNNVVKKYDKVFEEVLRK